MFVAYGACCKADKADASVNNPNAWSVVPSWFKDSIGSTCLLLIFYIFGEFFDAISSGKKFGNVELKVIL